MLRASLLWASLNWLLDAASLWCFLAAFGSFVNPAELFAAYGIANVLGVVPFTPGGLGVIDSTAPLLLVSFGVTRSVATLGVLAWRLVNFWLPIPAGAAAYVSLKVPRGGGLKAARRAVAEMMSRSGGREDKQEILPNGPVPEPDQLRPGRQMVASCSSSPMAAATVIATSAREIPGSTPPGRTGPRLLEVVARIPRPGWRIGGRH